MISNLKVHIVGGTGQMGNWLKIYLESQGIKATASGSKNLIPQEAKEADIVFISVPISVASEVIIKVSEEVTKDCLLIDLSSVKSEISKTLRKIKNPSLSMHLLFGPTVSSIQNQKIVFCRIRDNKLVDTLKSMLEKSGAQVLEMTADAHDKLMANIQSLTHFTNLSLGKVLLDEGIDITGKISTPVFLSQSATLGRILSQPPKLLSEIQLGNSKYLDILERFIKYQQKLKEIIKKKDLNGLEKEISKIHQKVESTLRVEKVKPAKVKSLTISLPKKKLKIGFLGPEGTFSHQATQQFIKGRRDTLIPCKTIYDIFDTVSKDIVDLGLVPAENSTEGTVRETLDYLIDFDLKVNLALDLRIHQNLLSKAEDLKDIKRVISHPQGIAQTREWLRANLPQVKTETASSTVAAVTQLDDKTLAMIGPSIAAKIYRLNILAKDIEDIKNNVTRFYVISKSLDCLNAKSNKTLLFLSVFNRVGILRDILDVFASNNINLSKLESRPSREKVWDYHFFIEVEIGLDDAKLEQALNILKQYCPKIIILGGE